MPRKFFAMLQKNGENLRDIASRSSCCKKWRKFARYSE
jgi:hypothetical protein